VLNYSVNNYYVVILVLEKCKPEGEERSCTQSSSKDAKWYYILGFSFISNLLLKELTELATSRQSVL